METDREFAVAMSRLSGGITLEEAAYLSAKASEADSGCIVEVGSFKGKSAVALSRGARQGGRGVTVFCIEPHAPFQGALGGQFGPRDRADFYQAMLATGSYQNTALINLSSEAVSENWKQPVVLCFIDGDHRYAGVKRDWDSWSGHVPTGGCVIFDDASDPSAGPARLIGEILAESRDWKKIGAPGKFAALRRIGPSPASGTRSGGKNILVACGNLIVSGGLLRFERLARAIAPWGHRLALTSLTGDGGNRLFNDAKLLTVEEAAKQRWDAVMIPGAGFTDETIARFKMFREPRYGLRVQHILNDPTRKEQFLEVNRALAPDMVIFNNSWPDGSYTSFGGKQFHVLVGAVDTTFFVPPSPGENPTGQDRFTVGASALKSAPSLFAALETLPARVRLVLIGVESKDRCEEAERLRESGRLEYAGVLDDRELLAFYRSIDVLISTETSAGWSNMAAEAAASGTPIICTRAGTTAFAEHGKTALILETPDAEPIARAIRDVMEHPDQAAGRAGAARMRIEEFSWEQYACSLLGIIERTPESHYYRAPERGLYGKWPLADRFQGLEACFKSCAGKRVLDLGAAEGLVALRCLQHGAAEVTGFEMDTDRVQAAKNLLAAEGFGEKSAFHAADVGDWDGFVASCGDRLSPAYDVVLYLGLHQHLGDNRLAVLKGALKRARELFVVRTPASFWERDAIRAVVRDAGWEPIESPAKDEGRDHLGEAVVFRKTGLPVKRSIVKPRDLSRSFVSYPKSGRTWIRFALIKAGIPETIAFHHDGFEFNDGSKPALDFDLEQRLTRFDGIDRIVYLERDPRDVMCSLYHQITGRFKDFFHYRGTMSDFLRDPYFGARNLHRFRQMWAELRERREVLKVTYEQMTEDPVAVLSRIVRFYGFDVDELTLRTAVEKSSFDRMRAVEQSKQFEHPWLRPRNEAPKVRSGKVGGYLDELDDRDIEFLNRVFGL
ncbi:sulfotransferase domain-containing protein [Pseudodesulfovibrio indicus]|uniref:sulfotransferase domain-containing protein n=1 Tax=Pseudodesulfovibrio indicus TaxID=1716143 RepID=UPI00292E440C|nr:sulfotransferase domain-containing protein [Pseudodesulfovibrio indicus]